MAGQTRAVVEYLSPAWLDAIRDEVAQRPDLAELARTHTVGFTQEITDGPTYHVSTHTGAVEVGWGPAEPEDVRLRTDRRTAAAVASGTMNAQEAFITGHLRLSGAPDRLLEVQPLLAALDRAMAAVAARTTATTTGATDGVDGA